MVQCEMCGTGTQSPKTVKVEGAELDVCSSCAEFGTEVKTQQETSTSTKYSASSTSDAGSSESTSGGDSSSSGAARSTGRQRRDMFDEMEELAQDYDDRIRAARESTGISQDDLAKQLNEKASLIRKLERGETLPSDDIQRKLERKLGISLTEAVNEDADWEGGSSTGEYTLGDVVTRKDS